MFAISELQNCRPVVGQVLYVPDRRTFLEPNNNHQGGMATVESWRMENLNDRLTPIVSFEEIDTSYPYWDLLIEQGELQATFFRRWAKPSAQCHLS